eukprot:TRINITY_DN27478_c0_g1_i3.p1 TRINITY_DN27478_c0_g1~~TRINITY_DN27478_c0_g1_i3.p1  ORF type:complete len:497 (+),score=111.67 TRINITY_DN27478_c0_g1_i3:261-1751(+)
MASLQEKMETAEFDKWNAQSPDPGTLFKWGTEGVEARYYELKAGVSALDPQAQATLANTMSEAYLTGLRWVMHYYLADCPDMSWCYPFHFPPLAQHMAAAALQYHPVRFETGTPIPPLAQLLSVLPRQSAHLLPKCAQWLALQADSPLANNYPETLEFDPNGKDVSWQWTVKLPFVSTPEIMAQVDRIAQIAIETSDHRLTTHCATCTGMPELAVHRTHPLAAILEPPSGMLTALKLGAALIGVWAVLAKIPSVARVLHRGKVVVAIAAVLGVWRLLANRRQSSLGIELCASSQLSGLATLIDKTDQSSPGSSVVASFLLPSLQGKEHVISQLVGGARWPPPFERCNRDCWERSYRRSPVPIRLTRLAAKSSQAMMDDAIKEQVEYYLSSKNLEHDAYTVSLMDPKGWIQITDLLKYERLGLLAACPAAVLRALGDSESVEIRSDRMAVRSDPNTPEPAIPAPRPKSTGKKINVCFDFQKGKCTRGQACVFAHVIE